MTSNNPSFRKMAVNIKKYHSEPFLCNCGPCKRFWRSTLFNNSDTLLNEQRGETLSASDNPKSVAVGDRVRSAESQPVNAKNGIQHIMGQGSPHYTSIHDDFLCVVKFVGFVDENAVPPTLRIGIKLDESVLLGHDGVYNGKRYFNCTNGHGIFVKYTEITQLQPPNKRPPVQGNTMFPSWPEICKMRKQREKIPGVCFMLSGLKKCVKKLRRLLHLVFPLKCLPPPLIHPRETKTQKLRRTIKPYPFIHDTFDNIIKDQELLQQKEKLTAYMRVSEGSQIKWEDKQIRQWRQKYADPEKVKRMGETLKKLSSAYQEGLKLRDTITPELE
ncbi:uncharacterized protein LOC112577327 [Pomacea canaliculata]|uniref:uncharacterized protein LOC112577327 n=1 Tax=Pomacea canaliculata TaxID=400727 RepID=UPI000D733FCD|nr:uncharacterized protein LOC112577327 [Pomacea canaliculata]